MKNQLIMKKFFTFFAMMFALLGFSIPVSADEEYTVYVDVSAKGWSDCYLKTHWSDKTDEGWHIPTLTSKTNLGNGLYKFVFSYGGLKDVIISKNNDASNRGNEGTDNVGWFSPSKTGDWEFASGKLYTLASGTSNSAKVTTYTEPKPAPYIFIDGSCIQFEDGGDNWVYTVDASTADKAFRLQTVENTTSLGSTSSMASYTVIYGGTTSLTSAPISEEKIFLYGQSNYAAANYKAAKGYFYKISIGKSGYNAAQAAEGSNSFTWTVTPTAAKPLAPVLPTYATDNAVVIGRVSGTTTQIYYTTTDMSGDPSTTSWTAYTDNTPISLTKGYTTFRAAAYDGSKWSDVVTKTYSYNLPQPEISINVHTGLATITVKGWDKIPADANPVILCAMSETPVTDAGALGVTVTDGTATATFDLNVEGATSWPIRAAVRAWGGGDDHTTNVEGQTATSEVRTGSWIGPAAVRRVCLWGYDASGNPRRLAEFNPQDDGSYKLPRSGVKGTSSSDLTQRYFIRVVMNHDDPNNEDANTGGTYYGPATASAAELVANGTTLTSFATFTPGSSDRRGFVFDGADNDLVTITVNGSLVKYTLEDGTTKCSRFTPSSLTPSWDASARIKEVVVLDADGNTVATLTNQEPSTGDAGIWSGISDANVDGGDSKNPAKQRYRFRATLKNGSYRYYTLGEDANYWLPWGNYDSTTTPAPKGYDSASSHWYFVINETPGCKAQFSIKIDSDDNASAISIAKVANTERAMDISGNPDEPAIFGEGSEVGSWTTSRDFVLTPALGEHAWVYAFNATASTGYYVVRGSKGNVYAPVGLDFNSPTTLFRQLPDNSDAAVKKRNAAKITGLTVGSRYRFILREVAGDVQMSIEALPESQLIVKAVAVERTSDSSEVLSLAYDEDSQSWKSATTYAFDGNTDIGYRFKITMEYADGFGSVVKYATWSKNNNHWLTATTNTVDDPYNFDSNSDTSVFKVQHAGSYYAQAQLKSDGTARWLSVSTALQTPPAVDPTPFVNTEAWSLSDDKILGKGETKYFYMSALQNDNRLSPEWELVKNADGKYVLDNFVVIPDAQFIIRGVTKSDAGTLSVTDWGWGSATESPYYIYATKSDFKLDEQAATLTEASRPAASFKMASGKERGFMWNIGATMVKLEFDPSATGDNLKATIDFSYPSTLAQAPIKGFPWVGLTSSNITARVGGDQKYNFASGIGVSGLTGDSDLMGKIAMTQDGVESAFTNAFIQWTDDEKVYVYDAHVNDQASGKNIYYFSTGDNRNTTCKPNNGQVMSSTILPPRTTPQFKQYTSDGVTSPSAESLTFKYIGKERKKFTSSGTTTRETEFAVYEITNIELQGLFKVFTGYGGRTYGKEVNGLTFYPNWGVKEGDGYTNEPVTSTMQLALGGGGQVIALDSNGHEVSYPPSDDNRWRYKYVEGNGTDWIGDYDANHDNAAGKYFRLDNRKYVSSLRFYLALEPDMSDTSGHTDHNPRNGDHKDTYNNGRNYSWLDVNLEAERPIITLNKRDAATGRARWTINRDHTADRPPIISYKTALYKIDKDNFDYDATTGEPVEGSVLKTEASNSYSLSTPYPTYVDPETRDVPNLADGWFIARIYDVEYDTTAWSGTIKDTDKWNYSQPIYFFSVKGARLHGEQRVTEKDGRKVYHPIIRVVPDISDAVKDLPEDRTLADVSAEVTVTNIGANSQLLDAATNPMQTVEEAEADGNNNIRYKRISDDEVVVYYPKGYLTDERQNTGVFSISGTKINDLTHLSLQVHIEGAADGAPVTANPNTYMPAGKLFGTLVAAKEGNRFNYLKVQSPDDVTPVDDYARIYFVDRNNDDEICYISGMEDTDVVAQVWYVDGENNIALFDDASLLNMKANPDDESIYRSKRLKVSNLPYKEDTDTDIDGSTLNIRQNQTAGFLVQLTYTSGGLAPWNSRQISSELELTAKTLTSPRQGLKDVLTQEDADARGTDATIATDVTAVSESFVEKYGGLFTNIEDAHVALNAVDPNEELVSKLSLDKWYMDHGDMYLDGVNPNPFSPRNHWAVGQKGCSSPSDAHPLLVGKTPVASANDFYNTDELNNAWWNQRAQTRPVEYSGDHIKGTLSFANGTVTWTAGNRTPSQHRSFWAGVKDGNDAAYQEYWNNGVLEVEGTEVDVRDPQHSLHATATHFTTVRSPYYLGEIPLNANDILCLIGQGDGSLSGNLTYYPNIENLFKGADLADLKTAAINIHNKYDQPIYTAANVGQSSVSLNSNSYDISIPADAPWNLDKIWATRAKIAHTDKDADLGGITPAEYLFKKAGNHMFFKVNHVNHETWFVPGGGMQHDIKTRPIWPAFQGLNGWPTNGTDTEKENFVMDQIRMNLSDYCPLAYDVRYIYPFLTSSAYVKAENYQSAARVARAAGSGYSTIAEALADVKDADITDIAARDKGRVSFFGATEPKDVVPTLVSDVADDIRANGFSIVYNRAAGTVTVTSESRRLDDVAIYDAAGASLVRGADADRVDDHTIVLDVRGIAQGAYIVSTNLGGAKFMK